jgi:hypothetical protein
LLSTTVCVASTAAHDGELMSGNITALVDRSLQSEIYRKTFLVIARIKYSRDHSVRLGRILYCPGPAHKNAPSFPCCCRGGTLLGSNRKPRRTLDRCRTITRLLCRVISFRRRCERAIRCRFCSQGSHELQKGTELASRLAPTH